MTTRASGTFDVKLNPLGTDEKPWGSNPRQDVHRQQLHGDLQGTSKGEMLTAITPVKASAVYVAIERVTGTLKGCTGSFVLHHTGISTRGAQQLTITVVPDSGTGQLTGLGGQMTIKIADGAHSYAFEYTLPEAP